MKLRLLTLGALTLCSAASIAVASEAYRVTAIVAGKDIEPMALLELSGNRYRRVHVGDALFDGTVVEIASRSVRVDFPDGEKEIWLKSGTDDGAAPAAAPVTVDAAVRPAIELEVGRLVQEKDGDRETQWQRITELLTRVLALPEGARIVEVDGVTTTDTELSPAEQLQQALDESLVIGVTIAGDPTRDRVYIEPQPPTPPSEVE